MNGNNSIQNLSPDDVFEEAVGRLEDGESIEAIVAAYPYADADELRDELHIVQLALEVQHEPVPQPIASTRMAAKQSFLAAASEIRSREEAAHAYRPVRIAEPPRRAIPASTEPDPSFLQRILDALQSTFSMKTMRLAPIIALLAIVLLTGSSLVVMAQSSVPGDATYSFKQWMRKQELQLSRPDQRDIVRQAQEQELASDVAKAAERADANSAVIQAEDTQIFYGKSGRLLKIGGLTVMDRYQPNANEEVFRPMEVDGDLAPGAKVGLVYQIMPGQSDTVQGISLVVLAAPAETATPAPTADEQEVGVVGCNVAQPEGWVEYTVVPGDNLSYIARRGAVDVNDIVTANCLNGETIVIDQVLYVPADAVQAAETYSCGMETPAGWEGYVVQVGDNLTSLANERDTTVDDVMKVNCLDSDTILIGQELALPAN